MVGTAQVRCFETVQKSRLKWLGYLWRRDAGYIRNKMLKMELTGKIKRGHRGHHSLSGRLEKSWASGLQNGRQ